MGYSSNALDQRPEVTALEFFAGIGLARAGMAAAGIETIWANDHDKDKESMYSNQWGSGEYLLEDVHKVAAETVPTADVAWSSSPCTDLSLAGMRGGLEKGRESSAFYGFIRVLKKMENQGRLPQVVVLENVVGLATSHGGEDLRAAALQFNDLGYSVDVVTLDARSWLPQSRPRIFMVGATHPINGGLLETSLRPDWISKLHADETIRTHVTPTTLPPALMTEGFTDKIELLPEDDTRWWDNSRVAKFLGAMSTGQRKRLNQFVEAPDVTARTAYRRTRAGVPMWEMRPDDISGCLRTARGGSSKQAVVLMGNGNLRIRWMIGLEYAQLMGADTFTLDGLRDSQVHYGFGDAVAVPAVKWVAEEMILPTLWTPDTDKVMRNQTTRKELANA
ncbi:DNA cytosine methyltransferase [Kocuria rosea]|uniref:DNA cytosine methyltransferase n=1 Tax=Kocuria rosea TaxID=1275 RepID=UPI003D32B98F